MNSMQMSGKEIQDMIDAAKTRAGINDVIKLHQDYVNRVKKNNVVLRTRYHKGILLTSSSTY